MKVLWSSTLIFLKFWVQLFGVFFLYTVLVICISYYAMSPVLLCNSMYLLIYSMVTGKHYLILMCFLRVMFIVLYVNMSFCLTFLPKVLLTMETITKQIVQFSSVMDIFPFLSVLNIVNDLICYFSGCFVRVFV